MHGLLLCDDLIFTSRIVATAAALGIRLRAVKSSAELRRFLLQDAPGCVILDLQLAGADVEAIATECSMQTPRPRLIGYGSHVDTATLKRARDAELDVVWPRSKFVDELTAALPQWFAPREATS